MSQSTYRSNIDRLGNNVADLLKKQNAENKKLLTINSKIAELTKRLINTSSLSSSTSLQRQIESKQKEALRIEKKIADFEKQLVAKRKELNRNKENLGKCIERDNQARHNQDKQNLREKLSLQQQELTNARNINIELEKQSELFKGFSSQTQSAIREDSEYDISELIDLNKRIDAVLEKLELLGFGQEILFEEIESLKDKSKRISKKDLNLMLIGQIVSFGAGKIDNETASYIFETISKIDFTKILTQ